MRYIQLTRDMFAKVDDEDYEELIQYKWYATNYGYAARNLNPGHLFMHRLIMKAQSTHEVDHINFDRLDNRKENLRLCTPAQNGYNKRVYKSNRSGIKGVRMSPFGKWEARIQINGKAKFLGSFDTPKLAADAYDIAAETLFGEYARLNKELTK